MITRKRILAPLGGVLAVTGAAAALAAVTSPNVTVQAQISPNKAGTVKHPQGEKLKVQIKWQSLGSANQPIVQKFDILFPRGAVFNGAKYPTCSLSKLNNIGPSICPKGSIMGSGTGNAYADTVITHPKITVVNGGAKRVYFYTVLNNPARVQLPVIGKLSYMGTGKYAYRLLVSVPPELQVVAGVPIELTSLTVNAGDKTWLATSSCGPGGHWPFSVTTSYNTGGSAKFNDSIPCR
jgi:hypothetical protein